MAIPVLTQRLDVVRTIKGASQYMSFTLLTELDMLTSRAFRPTMRSRFYFIIDKRRVAWHVCSQSYPALYSDFFVTGSYVFRMRQQTAHSVMAAMSTSSCHSSYYLPISCIKITVTLHTHNAVHWNQVEIRDFGSNIRSTGRGFDHRRMEQQPTRQDGGTLQSFNGHSNQGIIEITAIPEGSSCRLP
jgi:hypothetical protein